MTAWSQIGQFMVSGMTNGSIYALIAIGFSIIHNATGMVNFAQGEFVMLGGMMMITFYNFAGLSMPVAFVLSIISVALVGMLLERGPIRHSRSPSIVILVLITIGASIFIKGLSMHIWGKSAMTLPPFAGETPIRFLHAAIMPQSLFIFGITILAVTLLHLFFGHTLVGRAMRASAANPLSAQLTGISASRMVMLSFMLSGGLGAMAGIMIAPITTTSYDVGVMLGLKGFCAAILGGYGSMPGAVLGGILLGVLESLNAGLISSEYKDAIAFLILILVLVFRPTGILGQRSIKRV
ncbi:MAG: branched-chain amino acid ABC transporter permease [Deltaproteobacteria bacterium]|nr:branched-chain amino acid ABC transporter permease [Deltaproteobacteria bacterium]MBW2308416.1 branched-chain amino acid ABC transporter permease [Deltaproteobacteria bacterium]